MDALEIGNQIKRFPGHKYCKLGAICASAGTVIATYFDEVETSANTLYMIHDPIVSPTIRHPEDWESSKAMYDNIRMQVIDRYVSFTGLPKEEVETMMKATTWMNSKTAKAKKFVHKNSDQKAELPEDARQIMNQFGAELPQLVLETINHKPLPKMEKIIADLGLQANATQEEMITAYNAKIQAATLKAAGNTETGIKALVSLAESKGLKKENIEKLAKVDFESTLNMVMELKATEAAPAATTEAGKTPEQVRMTDILDAVKNMGSAADTKSELKFSERLEKDKKGLKAVFDKEPAKVVAMFKEEYGADVKAEELAVVLG